MKYIEEVSPKDFVPLNRVFTLNDAAKPVRIDFPKYGEPLILVGFTFEAHYHVERTQGATTQTISRKVLRGDEFADELQIRLQLNGNDFVRSGALGDLDRYQSVWAVEDAFNDRLFKGFGIPAGEFTAEMQIRPPANVANAVRAYRLPMFGTINFRAYKA